MTIFPATVLAKAAATRLLILDVDGVLTDGRIYYLSGGGEAKAFNTQDGAALKMLMGTGVATAIITGRRSDIVERRARELGITHVHQGVEHKATALTSLCEASGVATSVMAHVGDDVPDLELFNRVALRLTVPSAHPEVITRADYVTHAAAGMGAVAEVCRLVMTAQNTWQDALARFT
ncbi:MAG: HAD hydrolase family protein [Gammaproteobacteria bacterium]|nr:HAD hydrolase family protein [Gammaproteobacteria bacterium]